MADPTDKDRDRAEQIVVTAMRSEIFRDALVHDTTRALEAVAAQGQADERARIVAALRRLAAAEPGGPVAATREGRMLADAADALERGEL